MLGFSQSQVIAKKHLSGGKLGVKIEEKSWAWAWLTCHFLEEQETGWCSSQAVPVDMWAKDPRREVVP